jgi:hypothetical protein
LYPSYQQTTIAQYSDRKVRCGTQSSGLCTHRILNI